MRKCSSSNFINTDTFNKYSVCDTAEKSKHFQINAGLTSKAGDFISPTLHYFLYKLLILGYFKAGGLENAAIQTGSVLKKYAHILDKPLLCYFETKLIYLSLSI